MTHEQVVEAQAWTGLRERLRLDLDEPIPPKYAEYTKRMEHELGVITSMGFAGYFLIVADFINYAKKNNIPVGPGRGSAAGSLAAYSLGISDLNTRLVRLVGKMRYHTTHGQNLLLKLS